MELHRVHQPFYHSHLGDEKHQMLNLNQRLETYLSQVKLLEEENAHLAKEIQALRHSNHGALSHRKSLEEELRQARLEVDAAWKDRVYTEVEVGKLTEELQTLDLQRQKVAQARVDANKKSEKSRQELEEEHRAQIWLKQKVSQLEHEMTHLIQTHQDNVAHLEAKITHSRAAVPTTFAQRGNLTPNLLQLDQEYSQRANRAWQETAEAHQGQLAWLEESLNQARSRLMQVGQEKSESQLKLRALEKEIASAQDVRMHLEKTAFQQRDKHSLEIQQLQDHLEGLEAEKGELGQQIDCLLLKNRDLLQQKMSLGMEVSTYRALLDSESLGGNISLLNQPRNIFITDTVFSPQGVKRNYQTQLPASHKTTSFSSVCSIRGKSQATVTNASSVWSRKPIILTETAIISRKHADDNTTKSSTWGTPYPKILQDGAIENFRPQEVHEKVTYAEPLSPPNEQEAHNETFVDQEEEDDWNNVAGELTEEKTVESVVSYEVEPGLSSKLHVNDDIIQHQFQTTPSLTPYHEGRTEELCGFSVESDKDWPCQMLAAEQEWKEPQAQNDAFVEKEYIDEKVEHVKEETSDSETEAVLEPTYESRTSSPLSECEPEESVFNQVTDLSQDENILKEEAFEIKQEKSSSMVGTNEMEVEDKLYPDGEEMDTYDSVMERKVDLKTDDDIKKHETNKKHAEPEEDVSVRDEGHNTKETRQDFATNVQQDDNMASSLIDAQVDYRQHAAPGEEHSPLPDDEEDENDEEDDSPNVSISWRTEVESDSYALDNTLADPRPLIRYKSDDTDANTQASHMDESESSEGEQEKKVGETGTGEWSEDKSKKFGTMEDLCEEVEGEALDEEYDLGYAHIEDRDVGNGMTVSEHTTPVNDDEDTEEMIEKVDEGQSDEESEQFANPMVPTYVDYDEELETDRLVEQELENLSTDSYSVRFAFDDSEAVLPLQDKSETEMTEQEESGKTKMEDMSSCVEPDMTVNHELRSSTAIIDQQYENLYFSELSVAVPQIDNLADEEVHDEEEEAVDAPEKEEEDEHNMSMVTHADVTEDQPIFSDFISRPDMEEINNSEDPKSTLHLTDPFTDMKEATPAEAFSVPQEHVVNDVADCQAYPEVQETAEWEVLKNPSEDFEIRDQNEDDVNYDNALKSAESYLLDDGGTDEGAMTHEEEPLEISPDSVPDENDIFVVKNSTELLNKNGNDSGLHEFFSSGVNNDIWLSSLETGATFQPDDAYNEAAEQTNKNLGFGDSVVWGNLENSNVVNGKSRVDIDSSKELEHKKEQEVKKMLCGNVKMGLVQSEEFEVKGESWSFGEESL
ncbi:nestin [Scomber scombrus]|uniref:Nestin n=1 Tax=Scomber scombrus TaxID=13677 RepID=A0AAV1PTS6_SCOSC